MLKALELVGFKSFADKTRLEFPRGITVVVGPNGSGKSNVVDAIKWVLGEQSVKSLRGKEMADVIFNGAAGRKPLHSAEVSLVFDNTQRLLALDTPEVQITRRVYRSGEGEYLVNRQPCRLRDIRDLLAGTGMATEAYSVIEQGKVDVLLQASPRERRLIFEEAAGISRFKAKKIEAQRRLERVEQNLLRLSDIVEEVESRLASVRQQATKAQRYKEHADRLQLLRTELGLIDWRRLTAEISAIESEVATARQDLDAATAEAESLQAQAVLLEQEIADIEGQLAAGHLRATENRERIAGAEAAIEHQRRRYQDLEEETARYRRQLTTITARADDLEAQSAAIEKSLSETGQQQRELAVRLGNEERSLARLTAELDALRGEHERARASHLEKLRIAATLSNRISAVEAQHQAAQAAHERGEHRLGELNAARENVAREHAELAPRFASLSELTAQQRREAKDLETRLSASRSEQAQLQREVAGLRERQSRASERYAVLEELERRQEGLTSGVKEVLQRARSAAPGPWAAVRGLVADLLQVHIERAPLIETALGEVAQQVVIRGGDELLAHLQSDEAKFRGRVTFLRLDAPAIASSELVDFDGEPGVLGRADRFVETAPEYAVLARRLLGRTWIVDTLARGLALAGAAGRGVNFVTTAGEMVSADGSISVGGRSSVTGLISRRSELRALRQLIADLTGQTDAKQAALAAIERQVATDADESKRCAAALTIAERDLSEVRLRTLGAEQRLTALDVETKTLATEVADAAAHNEQSRAALETARNELSSTEKEIAELDERLKLGAGEMSELEQTRQSASRETSATRIDVARVEQQLESLRRQLAQLTRDRQERGRSLADNRAQLDLALRRSSETELNILAAESELSLLYIGKEALLAESVHAVARRDAARERRGVVLLSEQRLRNKARKSESKLHARELAVGEARHSRATIEERLREDYAIELATVEDRPAQTPELSRAAMEHEIAELRARLNSIGSVNLDALAELEQLDARYSSLAGQHQDLATAKASLDEIIERINADSRRLFADTLEVVRGHFQLLFRKLFGGGQADILLDEGVDVLESGVEILARPPGKEPRSISLLSGGEKTLTCVALLMSIFRSRPSPFCVLDEVDAALDEANIERFIGVLQEFVTDTQFIVVTHSKKTMTSAGVIYGVTMQESGISKRVSVRFEDVSDDGEIIATRDRADAAADDGETQAA